MADADPREDGRLRGDGMAIDPSDGSAVSGVDDDDERNELATAAASASSASKSTAAEREAVADVVGGERIGARGVTSRSWTINVVI